MEWAANDPSPTLTLTTTEEVDNREWGNYHLIPNDNAGLHIGPFEFTYDIADDQSHLEGDEPVYFDFSDVVSYFPEWAFNELVAHYENGDPVFRFSEANYIIRESDTKCYLAARLSKNDEWVIGATLSRTNGIAFQKDGNSEKYIIAFVTPSKQLAARIL